MKCPICHSKFGVDDAIREQVKDEFIEMAAYFGRNGWMFVNEYVDCFRLNRFGSVTEKKRLRLLKELRKLYETCEFEFDKRRYRTDRQSIIGAMRVVADKEMFKFKDHNYLKQILINPFEGTPNVTKAQRVSAEGLTADEEGKKEDAALYKNRTARANAEIERNEADAKSKEELLKGVNFMKRNNLDGLLDKVGRKIE